MRTPVRYSAPVSLFNERIDVRTTSSGRPSLFAWRGRLYRVQRVIGHWEGEVDLVRVAAESDQGEPSIADISVDHATEDWTMRRHWS